MENKSTADVTPAKVMELRGVTGVGVLECKKFLVQAGGDIKAAVKLLREAGCVNAGKKASRTATDGVVLFAGRSGAAQALVEVNCETDFVARDSQFLEFASQTAQLVLAGNYGDVSALAAADVNGSTLEDLRLALVAKIGENINVRRFVKMVPEKSHIGAYVHGSKIGVLVDIKGGNAELAHSIAMHIAAASPQYLDAGQIPGDVLENERTLLHSEAQKSNKPAHIIEKIVAGRLRKHLAKITLLGQPYIKEPEVTVESLLQKHAATVLAYHRLEVGEGLEKSKSNFVEEVMAQVRESGA